MHRVSKYRQCNIKIMYIHVIVSYVHLKWSRLHFCHWNKLDGVYFIVKFCRFWNVSLELLSVLYFEWITRRQSSTNCRKCYLPNERSDYKPNKGIQQANSQIMRTPFRAEEFRIIFTCKFSCLFEPPHTIFSMLYSIMHFSRDKYY